jgi:hypothetical protein
MYIAIKKSDIININNISYLTNYANYVPVKLGLLKQWYNKISYRRV